MSDGAEGVRSGAQHAECVAEVERLKQAITDALDALTQWNNLGPATAKEILKAALNDGDDRG